MSDKEGHGGAEGMWTPPPTGKGNGNADALSRAFDTMTSQEKGGRCEGPPGS